jgi:hypothetical protein
MVNDIKLKFMTLLEKMQILYRQNEIDSIAELFIKEIESRCPSFWDISNFLIEDIKPNRLLGFSHRMKVTAIIYGIKEKMEIKFQINYNQRDKELFLYFL